MGLRLTVNGEERYFEALAGTDAVLELEIDAPEEAVEWEGNKLRIDYGEGANHVEAVVETSPADGPVEEPYFEEAAIPSGALVGALVEFEFAPVEGRNVVLQVAPGEWRPAQIVKVWSGAAVNLVVFLDGSNDQRFHLWAAGVYAINAEHTVGWATSRVRGDEVGQWQPRKPGS